MRIEIDFDLTDETIVDILTDAVETHALSYPCWSARDIKLNKDGWIISFVLVIRDEQGNKTQYLVNKDTVLSGVEKLFSKGFDIRKDILTSILNDNIDAEGMDCIIQAGIFGKIMYG
jgi:hypothetical protein